MNDLPPDPPTLPSLRSRSLPFHDDDLDDPPRTRPAAMGLEESDAWRPEISGWSTDILPFYREALALLPVTVAAVELGVFRGRSLLFLAKEASIRGHHGIVHGVDPGVRIDFGHPYPGFEGDSHAELLAHCVRLRHHRPGVEILIHRLTSREAVGAFADRSLDLVFVDANHERDEVARDIVLWTPKLKSGAILAGHDLDHPQFPGVRQAVDEAFPAGVFRHGYSVWWTVKR